MRKLTQCDSQVVGWARSRSLAVVGARHQPGPL